MLHTCETKVNVWVSCREIRLKEGKTGVEHRCLLRLVRQEIMINVTWKTKINECQNCIRGSLHHPFLSTTSIFFYILFSAYKHAQPPQTLIGTSRKPSQLPQSSETMEVCPFGVVPCQKETVNLSTFIAHVPS